MTERDRLQTYDEAMERDVNPAAACTPARHQPGTGRTLAAGGFIALLALTVLLGGCDGWDDAWGGHPEAEGPGIREVRVEPNPVVAGDTTRFTCIITSEPLSDFTFTWILSGGGVGGVETETNQYDWVAPSRPDTYLHQVVVSKKDGSRRPSTYQFEVKVIRQPASSR